jgi:adenine-specific DNA-methyltransferase
MASLFEKSSDKVRILDAGAGAGALFAALVTELCSRAELPTSIEVVAYENDENLLPHLEETMGLCRKTCGDANITFRGTVRFEDFISAAVVQVDNGLFAPPREEFTHTILNPPYKKINGETKTRKLLNSVGIETSNLYAAFVWLSVHLLQPKGELVAITPRSFCNGPYFRRFRKSLLELTSLRRIHVFESRKKAFADDSVLQENIIFHCVRGEQQRPFVKISVSRGPDVEHSPISEIPFQQVVIPGDSDAFIHLIEDDEGKRVMEQMRRFNTALEELGLEVSTGRVVDFRAREYLRQDPEPGTAPLIYPSHFENGFVRWPLPNGKKPNAIISSSLTEDLLVPAGCYVLTKRFTAKEERRRVVAAIYDRNQIDAPLVGFENHLNYFHGKGRGILVDLAKGLALFLNSSLFDRYFRLFSGHTQVNATDLRKMRYPFMEQILRIGRRIEKSMPDQETIDAIVEKECSEKG